MTFTVYINAGNLYTYINIKRVYISSCDISGLFNILDEDLSIFPLNCFWTLSEICRFLCSAQFSYSIFSILGLLSHFPSISKFPGRTEDINFFRMGEEGIAGRIYPFVNHQNTLDSLLSSGGRYRNII